jgi:hypothetical protein
MIKFLGSFSLLFGLFLVPLNLKLFSVALNTSGNDANSSVGTYWMFFSILFLINFIALFSGVRNLRKV